MVNGLNKKGCLQYLTPGAILISISKNKMYPLE